MRKFFTYLLVFLCTYQGYVYSQPSYWETGLKVSKEFVGTKNDGASIGVIVIYKFTSHSAFEAGISYKNNPKKYLNYQNLGPQTRPFYEPISEIEKTILIPLSYRYESKIINVSAGTGLNLLLNKKELAFTNTTVKTDWTKNEVEVMATIGISKNFRLNRTMYVEPEIKHCHYFSGGGSGIQLNLSFKKRFS
jgi:hypothetical protein